MDRLYRADGSCYLRRPGTDEVAGTLDIRDPLAMFEEQCQAMALVIVELLNSGRGLPI